MTLKKTNYVSCIKINGKPILPPLVTKELSKEIQDIRLKAIEIERKLYEKRNQTKLQTSPTCYNTIEHQLAFDRPNDYNTGLPKTSYVPSVDQKTPILTCNLVEVSEYSDDGMRTLSDEVTERHFSHEDHSVIQSSVCESLDTSEYNQERPRLIRSNSYILESPSPMLLAYIQENTECLDISQHSGLPEQLNDNQQQENCTSKNEDQKEMVEVENCTNVALAETSEHEITSEKECVAENNKTSECEILVTKEVPLTVSSVQTQLLEVLNNVPEMYAKQIIQLLQQQKPLDCNKVQGLSVQQNEMRIMSPPLRSTPLIESDHSLNYTSSQTIYYTINSSNETLNAVVTSHESNDNDVFPEVHVNTVENNKVADHTVRDILHCSKQLFPDNDVWINHRLKQERAASIIGAHVRGYLTRRLMATERVQMLIQTIKDALICAMELHTECNENINESDVELHRRLIQQVSAACYAFHDVFFGLPVAEQMAIIALDRQRKIEKAKRPPSVRSARAASAQKGKVEKRKVRSATLCRT